MPVLLYSSSVIFALSVSTFLTLALARPKQISNFTYDQVRACHFAESACRECFKECHSNRLSFFGSASSAQRHEDLVVSLQECLRETNYYRQWLPKWCINDQKGFYATQDFPANEENCLMQPIACSQHIEKRLRRQSKERDIPFGRYRLALMIGQLGRAQRDLTRETEEFAERKKKVQRIRQAWEEKWLDEALLHIEKPEENLTRYADPAFHNFRELEKENKEMDLIVSRNNIVSASVENKFVRRDTVDKIPEFINSIRGLKNQIHSKKDVTDRYLNEIKDVAVRTAQLQENATNIIYETTHGKELDGEIAILDKELLDLYVELKKERSKLRELNVRSTFAKLRLVALMRMTVQQVSRQQIRQGCVASEVMGF